MKTLIIGGDGYLGWPTAMYLAKNLRLTAFQNPLLWLLLVEKVRLEVTLFHL